MTRRRLLALLAAALLLGACSDSPSVLDAKGDEARHLAGTWWLMFGLAAAVYVVVGGFIVVAIIRRRDAGQAGSSAAGDSRFLWLGGIVMPVVVLAVLAVVTINSTRNLRTAAGDELKLEVVGKRWWWEVRYPDDQVVTANEIHVPVGRPVDIVLTSDNVVHSFWVPQLAGKVDMIPGQTNHLRFTAEKPGTYLGECAEFCGIQHARMRFLVIAEEPSAFDRWLGRRRQVRPTPTSEQEAQGQRVFMREACAGCHTIRGTPARGQVGPDLTDFGQRRFIGAVTEPNTEGHRAAWISNSQTMKPGNLMPPIALEPEELDAVVAYLGSLE